MDRLVTVATWAVAGAPRGLLCALVLCLLASAACTASAVLSVRGQLARQGYACVATVCVYPDRGMMLIEWE